MPESEVPQVDDPQFGKAIRIGSKVLEGSDKALEIRKNVMRFLNLTSSQLNFSSKSSQRSLGSLWGFKNPLVAASKIVAIEMEGETYSYRPSSRKRTKLKVPAKFQSC